MSIYFDDDPFDTGEGTPEDLVRRALREYPTVTTRPVSLNPEAWRDDEDETECCYCHSDERLFPAGFPSPNSHLVACEDCIVSYKHQQAVREAWAGEGW